MKVLFTVTYFRPYVSGLSLAAERFALGLTRRGKRVTILTMQHDPSLPLTATRGHLAVLRVPWQLRFGKGLLSFDWLIRSWEEVRRHDAVVINLPEAEGLVPALMARLTGKRVVSVYHCEIRLPPGFVNGIVQSLLEVSNFVSLLLSHAVVTYTEDYKRHSRLLASLTAIRPDIEISAIVPPIPKPARSKAEATRLAKRIGTADIVLGVAARLAAEKGIEYLLDALPLIRSAMRGKTIKIVIAGSRDPVGEQAYRTKITRLVRTYGRQVVFAGEIRPESMGSLYGLLDVLVLPSVNSTESFGMVQVEAMRWGVPVVASDLPGVRVPVASTGMGRIVRPRDSAAIADAVCAVLSRNKKAYTGKDVSDIFSEEQSDREFDAVVSV